MTLQTLLLPFSHLTREDKDQLIAAFSARGYVAVGLDIEISFEEVIQIDIRPLYKKLAEGWIPATAALKESTLSKSTVDISLFACRCTYHFVRFEEDVEPHPDLPVFV